MAKKISDLPTASTLDGTELAEAVQAGANVNLPLGAIIPTGYLDGLQMQWVSGTALTVTSGAAYILSLGRVLRVPASIAKTGLAFSASTWYHVYLWLDNGSPDIEIVTTAPAAPYVGTARAKTGDTTRRYLGSLVTDGSGHLIQVFHSDLRVMYANGNANHVLAAGNSTASVNVPCASAAPVTAVFGSFRFQNNGAASTNGYLMPGGMTAGASSACLAVGSLSGGFAMNFGDCPFDASQNVSYSADNTAAQLHLFLTAYTFER